VPSEYVLPELLTSKMLAGFEIGTSPEVIGVMISDARAAVAAPKTPTIAATLFASTKRVNFRISRSLVEDTQMCPGRSYDRFKLRNKSKFADEFGLVFDHYYWQQMK
jgi:hypothetical protein